jgi:hypothetical protein
MKTKSASSAPAKAGATPRELIVKISAATKLAEAAHKTAQAAKADFKRARKAYKQVKKAAKTARREVKALKKVLAAAKAAAARTKTAKARKPLQVRQSSPAVKSSIEPTIVVPAPATPAAADSPPPATTPVENQAG